MDRPGESHLCLSLIHTNTLLSWTKYYYYTCPRSEVEYERVQIKITCVIAVEQLSCYVRASIESDCKMTGLQNT